MTSRTLLPSELGAGVMGLWGYDGVGWGLHVSTALFDVMDGADLMDGERALNRRHHPPAHHQPQVRNGLHLCVLCAVR